jgi:hypothetical protein
MPILFNRQITRIYLANKSLCLRIPLGIPYPEVAGEQAKPTTRSLAHLTMSKLDFEAHGERREEMSLTCLRLTVSESMVSRHVNKQV